MHTLRTFALLALVAVVVLPADAAQTITICKKTSPSATGTVFPFTWTNGLGGPTTAFSLVDGQCRNFDITSIDHSNTYTENVPPGWSLTNISCAYTTSGVQIIGANSNPAFQPGDTTVFIDLNETNVTCTYTNERPAAPPMDVYAVKFICGSFLKSEDRGPVKPGNYLTAINVHNPNRDGISFRKKAVLLYRADKPPEPEQPMPPGKLRGVDLRPDWGLEIDCHDIRTQLLAPNVVPSPTFIKGWLVIEVEGNNGDPLPLDVTAVYTAHGWNLKGMTYEGFSEDVEEIVPKRVH